MFDMYLLYFHLFIFQFILCLNLFLWFNFSSMWSSLNGITHHEGHHLGIKTLNIIAWPLLRVFLNTILSKFQLRTPWSSTWEKQDPETLCFYYNKKILKDIFMYFCKQFNNNLIQTHNKLFHGITEKFWRRKSGFNSLKMAVHQYRMLNFEPS